MPSNPEVNLEPNKLEPHKLSPEVIKILDGLTEEDRKTLNNPGPVKNDANQRDGHWSEETKEAFRKILDGLTKEDLAELERISSENRAKRSDVLVETKEGGTHAYVAVDNTPDEIVNAKGYREFGDKEDIQMNINEHGIDTIRIGGTQYLFKLDEQVQDTMLKLAGQAAQGNFVSREELGDMVRKVAANPNASRDEILGRGK